MRRLLPIMLLLLVPLASQAQRNLCRKITRTVDRKQKITTFKSPRLKNITALRQFKTEDFFGLHLYMPYHHEMIQEKGASVTFSDGTSYKEPSVPIKCDQQMVVVDNRYMGGGSNPYMLQCFIHITPENYEQFATKRITAVYMADASAMVTETEGDKLKEWIKCLADKKPAP